MSASFIELDGQRFALSHARLELQGADWSLTLRRPEAPSLVLDGVTQGDRLRIDLRSLDALLEQLTGRAITTYPGGQNVCEAHLDVRGAEGGGLLLSLDVTFDWDRAIDPPDA